MKRFMRWTDNSINTSIPNINNFINIHTYIYIYICVCVCVLSESLLVSLARLQECTYIIREKGRKQRKEGKKEAK